MKLFLSSMHPPKREQLPDLLASSPERTPVTLLPNARDGTSAKERDDFITTQIKRLGAIGLENVNILDLRDFTGGNGNELKRKIGKTGLLWVPGGNTFALRYMMRVSGLEDELPDALAKGALTYSGYSAGSIAAGKSLSGINLETYDNPNLEEVYRNPGLTGKVINEGMRIVEHTIIPHRNNPDFSELTRAALERSREEDVLPLTDSQAAIFTDGSYQVVEVDNRQSG